MWFLIVFKILKEFISLRRRRSRPNEYLMVSNTCTDILNCLSVYFPIPTHTHVRRAHVYTYRLSEHYFGTSSLAFHSDFSTRTQNKTNMPMILFARIQLHWRRVRLRATVSDRLHLSRFNVYSIIVLESNWKLQKMAV